MGHVWPHMWFRPFSVTYRAEDCGARRSSSCSVSDIVIATAVIMVTAIVRLSLLFVMLVACAVLSLSL